MGTVWGVSASAVQRYEAGRVPRGQILETIARTSGRTIEWLLTGADQGGGGRVAEVPAPYGLNKAEYRSLRRMLDELLAGDDPEILSQLKRQLELMLKAFRR